MAGLWSKLNLKDQERVLILDAPASFERAVAELEGKAVLRRWGADASVDFLVAFVTRQAALDAVAGKLPAKTRGDAVVWIAYPKGTSKRYACEFNRDTGFDALGSAGFEGVRQVAIDEDWSALRFRRVEYIKKMKRDPKRALTAEGRKRTGQP